MNKQIICISVLIASLTVTVSAQTSMEELTANPAKSGGNYYAYPGPASKATEAPAGYEPFYISHYGRHGSRYMTSSGEAKDAYNLLNTADQNGKLTKLGKQVRDELKVVVNNMEGRSGDLTPLGRQQHQGIAQRMYHNYPQVFADGSAIDARSSVVTRCVLSMDAFCQELKGLNPKLIITNDASQHDMYYICKERGHHDRKGSNTDATWDASYEVFAAAKSNPERLMKKLFTSADYLEAEPAGKLSRSLFNIACDLQDMPNINFEMFSLFTPQERFDYWQAQNAWWYGWAGLSPLQDGNGPKIAGNLLQNIIDEADKAVVQKGTSATLRFGHDTGILPLISLMQLQPGTGRATRLDSLYMVWTDFKLIPMAANVQLIFYRKPGDSDVLLKVLLNENEVALPFKAYTGNYYRWSDFKNFYQKVADNANNSSN